MTTQKQASLTPAKDTPLWARRAAWGVVLAAVVLAAAVLAVAGGAAVSAATTALALTGVSPIPPMPVTGGILTVLLVWIVTLVLPALAVWAGRLIRAAR